MKKDYSSKNDNIKREVWREDGIC